MKVGMYYRGRRGCELMSYGTAVHGFMVKELAFGLLFFSIFLVSRVWRIRLILGFAAF